MAGPRQFGIRTAALIAAVLLLGLLVLGWVR